MSPASRLRGPHRHRGCRSPSITDSREPDLARCRRSRHAPAEGPRGRIGPAAGIDLAVDVGHVALDGVHADPQSARDLRVGLAARDGREDLESRAASTRRAGRAAAPMPRPRGRVGWHEPASACAVVGRAANVAIRSATASGSSKNRLADVPGSSSSRRPAATGHELARQLQRDHRRVGSMENEDRAGDRGQLGRHVDRARLAHRRLGDRRRRRGAEPLGRQAPELAGRASRARRGLPTRRTCPSPCRSGSAAPASPSRSSVPSRGRIRRTGQGRRHGTGVARPTRAPASPSGRSPAARPGSRARRRAPHQGRQASRPARGHRRRAATDPTRARRTG